MNAILEFPSSTTMTLLLGWTLIHFIWQATLIALIAWGILNAMRSRSANARYLTLCFGLVFMTVSPFVTFAVLGSSSPSNTTVVSNAPTSISTVKFENEEASTVVPSQAWVSPSSTGPHSTTPAQATVNRRSGIGTGIQFLSSRISRVLSYCVAFWCGGVLLLAVRLLFGLKRVRRWRHSATPVTNSALTSMFSKLQQVMSVRPAVALLQSSHVMVPTVIGCLKPIVLVPASLISSLTTDEIESILAHELAHIRRHDYLINLVQIMAETILFYHPAVWWISRRIRIERENCCDDVAVSVCGNRLVFATALAHMEGLRLSPERMAVAADGGSLISRIRRLTTGDPQLAPRWPAGMLALVMIAGILAVSQASATPSTSAPTPPTDSIQTDESVSALGQDDGTFQLVPTQKPAQRLVNQEKMATKPLTDTPPEGRPPILPPPPVRVTSTGSHPWDLDLQFLSPDIKRLKTINYSMGSRVSTDWVLVDGVRKPVDKGIEQDGIVVYVTLFGEVIAVDAKTKQVQWRIPWGKTQPMWKTISVVELDVDDQKKLAIELFATMNNERELIFNRVDLKTGEPIDSYNYPPQAQPDPIENEHPSPQTDDGPGDPAPEKGAGKQADDLTDRQPWSVQGRVTDAEGKPIKGALVKAHCGIGTLRQTGSASTDSNGKYAFRFGPGFRPTDGNDLIQAATISVSYPGHFEKNLHRQGDLVAAFHVPEGEIGWGDKTIDDVFLPGKPKTIDFVMLPATHLTGLVVISKNGKRPSGMRISLRGKKMPPSSSVVAHTTTDENGRFEFKDIPTGFAYQILVEPAKAESPWLAWASPAITFVKGNSGNPHIEHSIDGTESDFSFAKLVVFINGDGVNWKTALKDAASKKLELTWDGISILNNKIVAARSAFLEIGD